MNKLLNNENLKYVSWKNIEYDIAQLSDSYSIIPKYHITHFEWIL